MRSLAVDSTNDLFLSPEGNISVSRDLFAVMQSAQHSAQAQLGEMMYAIDQGVPNFQTIWESSANVAQFEAYLREAIVQTPGVVEVKELDTVVQANQISYTAVIATIYGTGTING